MPVRMSAFIFPHSKWPYLPIRVVLPLKPYQGITFSFFSYFAHTLPKSRTDVLFVLHHNFADYFPSFLPKLPKFEYHTIRFNQESSMNTSGTHPHNSLCTCCSFLPLIHMTCSLIHGLCSDSQGGPFGTHFRKLNMTLPFIFSYFYFPP